MTDHRPGHRPDHDEAAEQRPPGDASTVDRRSLLRLAGAAGGAAALGAAGLGRNAAAALQATPEYSDPEATAAVDEAVVTPSTDASSGTLPPDVPPWMKEMGPLPSEYGERSPYEQAIVRLPSSTSSRSPLHALHGTMTPNSLFFERHHAGVPAPAR